MSVLTMNLLSEIMLTKLWKLASKKKDAYHVACAIIAECKYFITTDDRLLKYQSEKITLVTPGEFIRRLEEKNDD